MRILEWHHWFMEELQPVYPSPLALPLTLQVSKTCLLREDFLALAEQKPSLLNYAIFNKRNVLTHVLMFWQQPWRSGKCCFFCNAMHPGTCRHCVNGCVSRTNSENSAFSVDIAQTEGFTASNDYNYHQHWLDIHMKSDEFSLNYFLFTCYYSTAWTFIILHSLLFSDPFV